jgi:dipeptidyl aminopeptidase
MLCLCRADRKGQNVIPVKNPQQGYLDVVPKDGFNHIAFFSPVDSASPIWLTKGDWGEVTDIAGVDEEEGFVYVGFLCHRSPRLQLNP